MRPVSQLAREALAVQDACNLSGVVHGFARAMRDLHKVEDQLGTYTPATHPIALAWSDKIASLTNMQCGCALGRMHRVYTALHELSQ